MFSRTSGDGCKVRSGTHLAESPLGKKTQGPIENLKAGCLFSFLCRSKTCQPQNVQVEDLPCRSKTSHPRQQCEAVLAPWPRHCVATAAAATTIIAATASAVFATPPLRCHLRHRLHRPPPEIHHRRPLAITPHHRRRHFDHVGRCHGCWIHRCQDRQPSSSNSNFVYGAALIRLSACTCPLSHICLIDSCVRRLCYVHRPEQDSMLLPDWLVAARSRTRPAVADLLACMLLLRALLRVSHRAVTRSLSL